MWSGYGAITYLHDNSIKQLVLHVIGQSLQFALSVTKHSECAVTTKNKLVKKHRFILPYLGASKILFVWLCAKPEIYSVFSFHSKTGPFFLMSQTCKYCQHHSQFIVTICSYLYDTVIIASKYKLIGTTNAIYSSPRVVRMCSLESCVGHTCVLYRFHRTT